MADRTVYGSLVRPVLFRFEAERAHGIALGGLSLASRVLQARPVRERVGRSRRRSGSTSGVEVMGLRFPTRVGVAGGLDKDGRALRAWPLLGFGFIEVGTVTAHAQPGNPAPRLFRLRTDEAVINRMGFNNRGSAVLAARLASLGPLPVPLGISIGKSKVTPVDDAVGDYLLSLRRLHRFADYVAINVSSPNTPGLRSLQDADALRSLLDALVSTSEQLSADDGRAVPLVVKVAPDLTDTALDELLTVCLDHGVSGIVATNTTLSRDVLSPGEPLAAEAGGLSGRPLLPRALEVVRQVRERVGSRLAVIGVGGVRAPQDALRMVDAGADLVQVYTGLVYEGPGMVRRVARALADAPVPSQAGRADDNRVVDASPAERVENVGSTVRSGAWEPENREWEERS
jgi:dihydroorotate dehydrogenase